MRASAQSEKRLAVLEELNRPGAGFAISARDLDLRGGGNFMSDQQSGHMQVFGPALSSQLLKLAVEKDHDGMAGLWIPELNLPTSELLPSSYVQSEAVRLEIYARAARCRDDEELEDLEDETHPSPRQAAAGGAGFLRDCQAEDQLPGPGHRPARCRT